MAELRDSETRDNDLGHAARNNLQKQIAERELAADDPEHEQTDLCCRSCSMRVWATERGLVCMRCGPRDDSQVYAGGGR